MECSCNGREHIVCRKGWRVPTATDPLPRISIPRKIDPRLVIRPLHPEDVWRRASVMKASKCPQCGRPGWIDSAGRCLTCHVQYVRTLRAEGAKEAEGANDEHATALP